MNKLAKFFSCASMIALLALSVAACTPGGGTGQNPTPTELPAAKDPTAEPTAEPTATPGDNGGGRAYVDSVEVLILESFPVQARALIKGNLSDPCTKIKEITQKREGNTFTLTIATIRVGGGMCAEVLSPFEESVSLDVVGLQAGTYTVNVDGVTANFTLDVDNVLR